MDDARSQDMLVLELRYPLRRMFQSCAVYCEPACCGLDSFDVNAYTLLWWIRQTGDEDVSHAMELLSSLVVKVAARCGPVASPDDLGHEWDSGEECAAYLSTWHATLEQAAFFG